MDVALKRTVSNLAILDGPMFSSSCDTSSAILLDLLKPEDEGCMILQNVFNHIPMTQHNITVD